MRIIQIIFFSLILSIGYGQKEDNQEQETKKGPKMIAEVIKDMSIKEEGLITIYHQGAKLYMEIDRDRLGEDMLLISRIAALPSRLSPYLNAGSKVSEQVVYWDKKGNKILLRQRSFAQVANEKDPIHLSMIDNNFDPIIESFKIEGSNASEKRLLINATKLFVTDVKMLSGINERIKKDYKIGSLDKDRSMIEKASSYPINTEIQHILTYEASKLPARAKTNTISLLMNQSFIKLPEQEMRKRPFDERVGWFSFDQIDYSSDALKADKKKYIRKWKLIPKDIEAYMKGELVEPIKPIVWYLDPATPEKWRKYFKAGIEDWNACFETAGFKNAVIAKDPPTEQEDPQFNPEDARYSVVRYIASETRNAMGPSVSDPRTGEIIESDIMWYHNHLRSYRNRYLIETGAANKAARSLMTAEEKIGDMIRQVIAHEVGHALGLPHNMMASAAYPVDSLRSASFTNKWGIAASIMDYARYNYVAQPGEDNVRFVRQMGPYDHYAINWGYRYIPEDKDQKKILDEWISEKASDPTYRFGDGYGSIDPRSITENISNDNLKATELGLKNLKYVLSNFHDWVQTDGQNYSDLKEIYGEILGVYRRYIGHVIANVGGIYKDLNLSDKGEDTFSPVSKFLQIESLKKLNEIALSSQSFLMPKTVINKLDPKETVQKVANTQARAIRSLLSTDRLLRIHEQAYRFPNDHITINALMGEMTKGIFDYQELTTRPDEIQRILQRKYVDRLFELTKTAKGSKNEQLKNTDAPAIAYATLKDILLKCQGRRTGNFTVNKHFSFLADYIEGRLDID